MKLPMAWLALAFACTTPAPRAPDPAPGFDYPSTRRDDGVVETLHGVAVADPYRWLESDTPEVATWFAAEDARARRRIAALPDVESRWQEMLRLWKPISAPAKTSFDIGTLPDGVRLTRSIASPKGDLVAIELARNGADMRHLRILDTRTHVLTDDLEGIEGADVVWTRDGFFYAFTPPDAPHADRWSARTIRFHRPGDPQSNDREVIGPSHDANAGSGMNPVAVTRSGDWLLVQTFGDWSRAAFALVDLTSPTWAVHALPPATAACVVGDAVYASVARQDGTTDIARVTLPAASFDVVAHEGSMYIGMSTKGAYLALRRAHGPRTVTALFDERFRPVATRETELGTTETLDAERGGDEVLVLTRQGLRSPPERDLYDPRTGSVTPIARAPVEIDSNALVVESIVAISADRTPIPITVMRRRDVALDGKAPLWAYGYGGFRVSAEQIFFPPWVAWTLHGGVFASCHVRGGLEYGEPWHVAGARRNRQASIDDFAACLSALHARGYSSPRRTMTQGWSHGGMLVSAVATQHPDLQRVVFATVPLTDMIRFPIFGRGGVTEYGDPEDPQDFAVLRGLSPYHHVRDGVAYPAFFLTASSNDERVAPMHARKLTAALQHASRGGEVLLKVNWNAGHHGGGREDANRAFAEATAFAWRELGM